MNTLGLIKQYHDIMNCRISYIFQQTDRQSNYHNDTERQLDPAPLACLLNCTNRWKLTARENEALKTNDLKLLFPFCFLFLHINVYLLNQTDLLKTPYGKTS